MELLLKKLGIEKVKVIDNNFDEIPFKQVIENLLNQEDSNKPVYFICIKNNFDV